MPLYVSGRRRRRIIVSVLRADTASVVLLTKEAHQRRFSDGYGRLQKAMEGNFFHPRRGKLKQNTTRRGPSSQTEQMSVATPPQALFPSISKDFKAFQR